MSTATLSSPFLRGLRVAATLALFAFGAAGCVDLTPCAIGSDGCICRDASDPEGVCDTDANGRVGICAAGYCFARVDFDDPIVCYDACTYANDGKCDDGGDGNTPHCAYGADCSDCGLRENSCPANEPVFCPQRFGISGVDQCWPAGTDCRSLRTCPSLANVGPYYCTNGGLVDCSAAGNGACVGASPCTNPLQVKCLSPIAACVPEFTNCETLTACPTGSNSYGICRYSETFLCTNGVSSCQGF